MAKLRDRIILTDEHGVIMDEHYAHTQNRYYAYCEGCTKRINLTKWSKYRLCPKCKKKYLNSVYYLTRK